MLAGGVNVEELKKREKEEKEKHKMRWFGTETSFNAAGEEYPTSSGLYSANGLDRLGQWQREGLAGLLFPDADDDEKRSSFTEAMAKALDENRRDSKAAQTLLYGGDIWNLDTTEFNNAVTALQDVYYGIPEKAKTSEDTLNIWDTVKEERTWVEK